jgi:hypothetical protein
MARTDLDEVFTQGDSPPSARRLTVVSRLVSDEDLSREQAPDRLRQAYSLLRQWSTDAQTTASTWDTLTTAQKLSALKLVVERLGTLSDRLADLLQAQRLDS